MQAILLAGGLGTRLRSVVSDRPKPMALVGDRPFMEYVVHELSRHGITDIIFAVGYKGSMVEEYFGDGSGFAAPDGTRLRVQYAYEEELLGTAGAIRNGARFVTEDRFFVLNADTFYQIDYSRLAKLQTEQNLDMALVLRRVEDVSRYGEAVLGPWEDTRDGKACSGEPESLAADTQSGAEPLMSCQDSVDRAAGETGPALIPEGRLTAFNEKTTSVRPGTINGGVYLMTRALLEEIPQGKVSLENDMIPKWLGEGRRLGGIVNDGYFIDIGVPEDYFRFVEDVKKGVVLW